MSFLNINITFKSGELIFRQKKKKKRRNYCVFPFFFLNLIFFVVTHC